MGERTPGIHGHTEATVSTKHVTQRLVDTVDARLRVAAACYVLVHSVTLDRRLALVTLQVQ